MSTEPSGVASLDHRPAREARAGRAVVPLLAIAASLSTNAALLVFFGFLAGIGPWPHVSGAARGVLGPARALGIDLALVLLFGLQHSVMARPAFKRAWTRLCPPALERSAYVLATALVLVALVLGWQPILGHVWSISAAAPRWLLHAGFAAGALTVVVASRQIDALALGGVRQAFEHAGWLAPQPQTGLVVRGLYRLVRHPIQSGFLLTLWCTPDMTAGRLLLAVAMSAYIAIGLYFEERELLATFGDAYRAYQRSTGAVFPRLLGRGEEP